MRRGEQKDKRDEGGVGRRARGVESEEETQTCAGITEDCGPFTAVALFGRIDGAGGAASTATNAVSPFGRFRAPAVSVSAVRFLLATAAAIAGDAYANGFTNVSSSIVTHLLFTYLLLGMLNGSLPLRCSMPPPPPPLWVDHSLQPPRA